jgi:hypothetical protein
MMSTKTDWWQDPAYWERQGELRKRRLEGFQKPWNTTAEAVLKHHEHELQASDLNFLISMAKRRPLPPKRDLERLKTIADRFDIK